MDKQKLFEQLRQAGVRSDDTVLIHSSMKAFGRYEEGLDALIDAFCEYLEDGLFLVPTHTWHSVNKKHPVFDLNAEPCTGILARTAVRRKDGFRSDNPTHSVVAFGKGAEKYIADEKNVATPTPRNGCYGKLIDRDGAILLVGVGNERNTFLHCLEEIAALPYRLSGRTVPYVTLSEGGRFPHPMKQIFCPYDGDVSAHFPLLDTLLTEGGAEKKCTIGKADSIVCRAKRASQILLPVMIEVKEKGSDYLLPDARAKYERRISRPLYRIRKFLFDR